MADDPLADEVLDYLRSLSKNLITSEVIHEELTNFRRESREDKKEIIYDIREQGKEIDSLQIEVLNLKNEFSNFKLEMAPIIELRQTIQKQVMRYSSLAFVALMGMVLGINQVGLS